MAGLMTVKHLRKLLSDPVLDSATVYIMRGDALIAASPDGQHHLVDFFNEELKKNSSAPLPVMDSQPHRPATEAEEGVG